MSIGGWGTPSPDVPPEPPSVSGRISLDDEGCGRRVGSGYTILGRGGCDGNVGVTAYLLQWLSIIRNGNLSELTFVTSSLDCDSVMIGLVYPNVRSRDRVTKCIQGCAEVCPARSREGSSTVSVVFCG
jgi:hypothetical protein